jgi:hypothetical protein
VTSAIRNQISHPESQSERNIKEEKVIIEVNAFRKQGTTSEGNLQENGLYVYQRVGRRRSRLDAHLPLNAFFPFIKFPNIPSVLYKTLLKEPAHAGAGQKVDPTCAVLMHL